MVDPVSGDPDRPIRGRPGVLRGASTTLVATGLSGCLAVLLAVLVGLLAIPWVASGLFFYNAIRAAPAADLYQQARPCAADGSIGNCVQLVHGTITAVDIRAGRRTLTTNFSVELPTVKQSGRMTTVLVGPPSWLENGQAVDATLYQGKLTQVGYQGSQADTDDNPVVHLHELLISGSMCLLFALVFEGGIVIGMRRGKKGSGEPPG
jgi:hypothetical protein